MRMMVVFIMEANGTRDLYRAMSGFMERQLLGSYSMKMFKQQTRLIPKTFHYLCNIVAMSWGREHFRMRSCIPIEQE
jgi:hypothetical protein